jgi:hypothetical protein
MSVEGESRIAGRRYGVSAPRMPPSSEARHGCGANLHEHRFNLASVGSTSMIAGHE